MTINSYIVRYSFHLGNTRKDLTATREGVSTRHVAGMESAEFADLFDLPRTLLFDVDGVTIAQLGDNNSMSATIVVECLV